MAEGLCPAKVHLEESWAHRLLLYLRAQLSRTGPPPDRPVQRYTEMKGKAEGKVPITHCEVLAE